ncbi:MAG: hypothetical protein IPM42_21065 [Saprospiraceae bacterium]|nr:hypothetical protein [Saprospiraceae bacterium]
MRTIQGNMKHVLFQTIFYIFLFNMMAGQNIMILDNQTKLPVSFSILKCGDHSLEADLYGIITLDDLVNCDTLIVTCLGYKKLQIPFKELKKTQKYFLLPLSFQIKEITITNLRINLFNEISTIIKRYQQKSKIPTLAQSELIFQTRIDSRIVENCKILSADQYSIRNFLRQLLRHNVMYSFAPENPFFSVDLDVLVKDYCNNVPNKIPNHLLQSKKIDKHQVKIQLLESELSTDSSGEFRTVHYSLKNGNSGVIKYNWPGKEIVDHSFEILSQNITTIYNVNPNNQIVFRKIKIKQNYFNGRIEKVSFISSGIISKTGEEVSSVLKLEILPSTCETIYYPQKLDNNIQEDASLLMSFALENRTIPAELFDENNLDTSLITVNNVKALNILDSFMYHKNHVKIWDKNLLIDSTQYIFIPKKYDGLNKAIPFTTPDFKTDIRWMFQKKDENALWQGLPSIWVRKDAYFIKDHPTIALFLAKVIFGIYETERIETLNLLNEYKIGNETEKFKIIESGYLTADKLSRKFVKSFSSADNFEIISFLHKLQDKLDVKYLLPDPEALYKFNAQKSIYSMPDIHYIIGNKEKAITEYHNMLNDPEIKNEQKALIYFNLSVICCELGEFEQSDKFHKLYINLMGEIDTGISKSWRCK